jgi:hypothetical protein
MSYSRSLTILLCQIVRPNLAKAAVAKEANDHLVAVLMKLCHQLLRQSHFLGAHLQSPSRIVSFVAHPSNPPSSSPTYEPSFFPTYYPTIGGKYAKQMKSVKSTKSGNPILSTEKPTAKPTAHPTMKPTSNWQTISI